jgi:membrane protein
MRQLIHTVDVEKPVAEVYDQWSRFEDLPRLMPGVVSVRQLDERTTSWVVVVAKERREFAAVTTEQRPEERIAWKGLGVPAHAGVVTFHRLAPQRTRVTVQLDWEPVGTFDVLGDRLGLVSREVDRALQSFARHVEAQTVPATGWRGTIEPDDAPVPTTVAMAGVPAARPSPTHGVPDDDLGRGADSPTELPAKGWFAALKRAFKQLKEDNVPILAAAVAFYLFLSLIPALGASISLYGLIAEPEEIIRTVRDLTVGLPSAAQTLLRQQAEQIALKEASTLSVSLALSVAAALFSASKGTQALVKALNIAYDEEETRGFVKLRVVSYGLTIGIVAFVGGAVVALVKVGNLAEELTGGGEVVTALRWPVLGLVLVVVLAVFYKWSPDRNAAKWRWTTPGALLAAVLLAVGSLLLSLYTSNFANDEEAGVLGAVGVLLLWLFVSAYIILLGAEVDSELEHQTARDSTVGDERPMGQREATMADNVAP